MDKNAEWYKRTNHLSNLRPGGRKDSTDAFLLKPVSLVVKTEKESSAHRVGTTAPMKSTMDVDNDLQCPVCLELFSYPIILPCSHVLCRSPCAEHLFDYNFIRCPVCRDNCYVSGGLTSLPRVLALENIIERVKKERESSEAEETASEAKGHVPIDPSFGNISKNDSSSAVLCEHCDKTPQRKARKFCINCNASYCGHCLRSSHPNKEPFNTHELVNPRKDLKNLNQSNTSMCSYHGKHVTLYCRECAQTCCLLCKELERHAGHTVISIDEAYSDIKAAIESSLKKLASSQEKVVTALQLQRDHLKDMQQNIDRKRIEINTNCDALIAEIENKRNFFLTDLEYEERVRQNEHEDLIKVMERILGSSQALYSYSSEVLKEEVAEFLEVADTLNEKLAKAAIDCEGSHFQALETDVLTDKIVEFKREQQILREINYLAAPSTPGIDITRCSRSEDTVVLVLSPPSSGNEVINQYEIHYCSEEQKSLEIEDTLIVKNVADDRMIGKGMPNSAGHLVVLIENLCKSTIYYFCVSASNPAGRSPNSEVVQCTTLLDGESVIPVPVIVESLCRQFTSSIQVYSSSPQDVAVEQHISHFLLYRQVAQNRAWKTLSLYGRQDHRVFGLQPNVEHEFIILACNQRGECQVSNRVILQTGPS